MFLSTFVKFGGDGMNKSARFLAAILLIFALGFGVSAATGASSLNATANVSSNGSCMVSLSLTLHMDEPVTKLYFPIPAGASGVRVNGSRVMTSKSGEALMVNLSRFVKNVTGDVSVNLQYDLYGLVHETQIGTLELQLPLLSGFEGAIDALAFTVTLPGQVDALPAFSSGYHQAGIEQYLTYNVEGSTITGSALKAMKNHETLIMTIPVDESVFGKVVVGTQSTLTAQIGMAVCAAVALLYWLLALRAFPLRQRCSEPPDGFSAGLLGSILGSGGEDLTLTVLTWAQLGYILIQKDRRGKILLHKRMDMGNERSDHEQRCFRKLFGSRPVVDATGARYAELRNELARKPAGVQELLHKHSGNPLVFRVLCCGIGLFAGGGIGSLLGSGAALQWLLTFLMAGLGTLSSWLVLSWTDGGLFRKKRPLIIGLLLSVVWVLLSLAAGDITLGLWMAGGLLIAGVLFGWSGRRTDLGKHLRSQVLGLRHYLRGGDKEQLRRACSANPDYYFRMAPYAIALGVGKPFAAAVGRGKTERCPYLTTGTDGHMSSLQWNALLERTVNAMDARGQNLRFEKLLRILNNLTKP